MDSAKPMTRGDVQVYRWIVKGSRARTSTATQTYTHQSIWQTSSFCTVMVCMLRTTNNHSDILMSLVPEDMIWTDFVPVGDTTEGMTRVGLQVAARVRGWSWPKLVKVCIFFCSMLNIVAINTIICSVCWNLSQKLILYLRFLINVHFVFKYKVFK